MAPKHGEPDSRTRNIVRWVLSSVVLVVAVGVASTYIYNKTQGAPQAVDNDRAISAAKDKADSQTAPASVDVTNPGKMWIGWVSDRLLDVQRDAPDYGFPGDDQAVHVGRPDFEQGGTVSTAVTLTLTGQHNTTVRVTSLRIVVDQRRKAPSGTAYLVRPQGDKPNGEVQFDLTSGTDVDGMLGDQRYVDAHTISLEKNEPVGLTAVVKAAPDSDIRYHFEVGFNTGNPLKIYNNAAPFRIVSYPTTARRGYMMAFTPTPNGGQGPEANYPCSWPTECLEYANNVAPQ